MKKTIEYLLDKKRRHIPITMVTGYDFPTAQIEDAAGVDSILVGDSVGTTMLGFASEIEVTMADMLHHVGAVARGAHDAFLISDMPYQSADTKELAEKNANLLIEKGAHCVKLEGWQEKKEIVAHLAAQGIIVCGHIGYNPQIYRGAPKNFATDAAQACDLYESAIALEAAGIQLLVIEKVPREVAALVSKRLTIPVIGIGCGNECDGQVLVYNDIVGLSDRVYRHARRYVDLNSIIREAVSNYIKEVTDKKFPAPENSKAMNPVELELLQERIKSTNK